MPPLSMSALEGEADTPRSAIKYRLVANAGVEQAIKVLRRKLGKDSWRADVRRHQFYLKPGERRRAKRARARARRRRAEARTARREQLTS